MPRDSNPKIIEAIKKECNEDEWLSDFLRGAFVTEVANSGKFWHHAEYYRLKIATYASRK